MSQLLAIVSLVLLLTARGSDAQVGSAPVNWGNDPSTVALWTFDGNANNVSVGPWVRRRQARSLACDDRARASWSRGDVASPAPGR